MKRAWLAAAVAVLMLLCGCTTDSVPDAYETPVTGAPGNDDAQPYYPEEAVPVVVPLVEYNENGDVLVTVHGGLLIDDEGDVLTAQQIEDGFIGAVRNEDKSVTYTIAGDRYEDFVEKHKQRSRDLIIDSAESGAYESIYKADPNEDFTEIICTADTEGYAGLDASEAIFQSGYYAIRAQAYDINAKGKCVVIVIDETTGEEKDRRVYPEEYDLFPAE